MSVQPFGSVWQSSAEQWEDLFLDIVSREVIRWLEDMMRRSRQEAVFTRPDYVECVYNLFIQYTKCTVSNEESWRRVEFPKHMRKIKESFSDMEGLSNIVLRNKLFLMSHCRNNNSTELQIEESADDLIYRIFAYIGSSMSSYCADLVWDPCSELYPKWSKSECCRSECCKVSKKSRSIRELEEFIRVAIKRVICSFIPLERLTSKTIDSGLRSQDIQDARVALRAEAIISNFASNFEKAEEPEEFEEVEEVYQQEAPVETIVPDLDSRFIDIDTVPVRDSSSDRKFCDPLGCSTKSSASRFSSFVSNNSPSNRSASRSSSKPSSRSSSRSQSLMSTPRLSNNQ